ncbi:MAG: KEOPS complex kinase/ATPase Bud32 [Candidatus Pacearchaeota archaeon]
MGKQLIAQGAEAKIFLVDSTTIDKESINILRTDFQSNEQINPEKKTATKKESPLILNQTPYKKFILKSRISKSYRHPIIDKQIRIRRTRSEAKILNKALSLGINVPSVIKTEKFNLEIEYIKGDKLSEKLNYFSKQKQSTAMKMLGEQTAKLHDAEIIHGDLTTSNTIFKKNKLFIIDFGLGFFSPKIEDKAVDLHLIKQALEAKHYKNYKELFEQFLSGYAPKDKEKIIKKLETVEKRGRYKH